MMHVRTSHTHTHTHPGIQYTRIQMAPHTSSHSHSPAGSWRPAGDRGTPGSWAARTLPCAGGGSRCTPRAGRSAGPWGRPQCSGGHSPGPDRGTSAHRRTAPYTHYPEKQCHYCKTGTDNWTQDTWTLTCLSFCYIFVFFSWNQNNLVRGDPRRQI